MPKHKQKETRPCYLLTRPNLREKAVWKRTPCEYSLDKLDMTFSDKKYAIEYILDQGAKENIYFLSFGKDWKNEYYVPQTTMHGMKNKDGIQRYIIKKSGGTILSYKPIKSFDYKNILSKMYISYKNDRYGGHIYTCRK